MLLLDSPQLDTPHAHTAVLLLVTATFKGDKFMIVKNKALGSGQIKVHN